MLLHRDNGKRKQWETPGGKVEPGESPKQTAVREIYEELGVKVVLIKKVGKAAFEENERQFQYIWFQAKINEGSPAIQEPQTFTACRYFTWDEISSMYEKLSANTKNLARTFQDNNITLT
ncbi:hypothetical protein A2W24_01680 [Microgenomates group bacterium RBG_16_45_19]|nr:MAG: hypothetical protein A2W24_01680 [Microgenomates group bacterium RBG_16_45_19]